MHSEPGRVGRPRSEDARAAVLHAVDDLLVEVGYAAMTMKGIAERAGVGRQTVYRWWSTKAEILFEAVGYDAPQELTVPSSGSVARDLGAYLRALVRFLTKSEAGAAYRALLGEAQHDRAVATLIGARDVVAETARATLAAALPGAAAAELDTMTALLVGPALYWIVAGRNPRQTPIDAIVSSVLATGADAP